MADMKIMVTGCNGQLGHAIKQVYENDANTQILGTDVPDLDMFKVTKNGPGSELVTGVNKDMW